LFFQSTLSTLLTISGTLAQGKVQFGETENAYGIPHILSALLRHHKAMAASSRE
jgi:hypothetical protein